MFLGSLGKQGGQALSEYTPPENKQQLSFQSISYIFTFQDYYLENIHLYWFLSLNSVGEHVKHKHTDTWPAGFLSSTSTCTPQSDVNYKQAMRERYQRVRLHFSKRFGFLCLKLFPTTCTSCCINFLFSSAGYTWWILILSWSQPSIFTWKSLGPFISTNPIIFSHSYYLSKTQQRISISSHKLVSKSLSMSHPQLPASGKKLCAVHDGKLARSSVCLWSRRSHGR